MKVMDGFSRTFIIMEHYLVVIERGALNYSAYWPDILGCVAPGTTVEETIERMKSALVMHLEGLVEDGDALPHPKGLKYYLSTDEPVAESGDLITHIEVALPAVA